MESARWWNYQTLECKEYKRGDKKLWNMHMSRDVSPSVGITVQEMVCPTNSDI